MQPPQSDDCAWQASVVHTSYLTVESSDTASTYLSSRAFDHHERNAMPNTTAEKELFLQLWEREFATTLKVLRAYPTGKDDFKPAEKSNTAKNLVWTLVIEQHMALGMVSGGIDFSKGMPSAPTGSVADLIPMLEKAHADAVSKVTESSAEALDAQTAFPSAPGQMGQFRIMDLLWTPLLDMIHHRGQLSVYLRMVGAKVPSIYGPTADEPWM